MKRTFSLLVIFLFIFVTGCSRFNKSFSKKEANKKIVLDYWENFYNKKDLNTAFALFADSAVMWQNVNPTPIVGRNAIADNEKVFPAAFPDGHFKSEGIYADGDFVTLRWYADGTNTGSLMGMPPTNKPAVVHGCTVYEVKDGKIQKAWDYWDFAGFMKQLHPEK